MGTPVGWRSYYTSLKKKKQNKKLHESSNAKNNNQSALAVVSVEAFLPAHFLLKLQEQCQKSQDFFFIFI